MDEKEQAMDRVERSKPIAAVLVEARKAHEDVGELLAAALQRAANQLGDVEALVAGRPGSWEADIVRRLAIAGGYGNSERIGRLCTLFVEMAEANEDGGEVISLAISQTVDDLSGFKALAEGSRWYWDLCNMGAQFSCDWEDNPYH